MPQPPIIVSQRARRQDQQRKARRFIFAALIQFVVVFAAFFLTYDSITNGSVRREIFGLLAWQGISHNPQPRSEPPAQTAVPAATVRDAPPNETRVTKLAEVPTKPTDDVTKTVEVEAIVPVKTADPPKRLTLDEIDTKVSKVPKSVLAAPVPAKTVKPLEPPAPSETVAKIAEVPKPTAAAPTPAKKVKPPEPPAPSEAVASEVESPPVVAAPVTVKTVERREFLALDRMVATEPGPPPPIAPKVAAPPVKVAAVEAPSESLPEAPAETKPIRDCQDCPSLVVVTPAEVQVSAASGDVGDSGQPAVLGAPAAAKPFAIGRTEITFDEWDRCVSEGGCSTHPSDDSWGRGTRPVINVSFLDVTTQFLPWLSHRTGHNYRLPTEAEWELAWRGDPKKTPENAAPEANTNEACGNGNFASAAADAVQGDKTDAVCDDGYAATAPVGSFKPNALGVFDMQGNVWEWVSDCWRPSFSASDAGSDGACEVRVLKGGAWSSEYPALRGDGRGWESAAKAKSSIGFRVVRSEP